MAEFDTDDLTVPDDEPLWRRIPKENLVKDQNSAGVRISSAAFSNDADGEVMSVMLASIMETTGGTEKALAGHETFGLAVITAKDARALKQIIVRDPLDDEPGHAVVVGTKSPGTRKKLTAAARWLVPPPGAVILGLKNLPVAMLAGVSEETAWRLLRPPLEYPPVVTPPPAVAPPPRMHPVLTFIMRGKAFLSKAAALLMRRV